MIALSPNVDPPPINRCRVVDAGENNTDDSYWVLVRLYNAATQLQFGEQLRLTIRNGSGADPSTQSEGLRITASPTSYADAFQRFGLVVSGAADGASAAVNTALVALGGGSTRAQRRAAAFSALETYLQSVGLLPAGVVS